MIGFTMNRSTLLIVLVLCCGCGSQSDQPTNPSVDLSKGRKSHKVDVSKLKFPDGFPKEIGLLAPVQVYEQQMETDAITWDTNVGVDQARDHYLAEFKKRKFETFVFEPKDMPGKNFEIRALDKERGVYYGVGIGKQRPESSVSCFIFSNKADETSWKQTD